MKLSDWVEDFDGTLARVLAHADLPPDPNCARFYKGESRVRTVSYAQVRQPVNARGLGRWRRRADTDANGIERSSSPPVARKPSETWDFAAPRHAAR